MNFLKKKNMQEVTGSVGQDEMVVEFCGGFKWLPLRTLHTNELKEGTSSGPKLIDDYDML